MQQRVISGHRQLGVGEGELGVVLGRGGRDEVRRQVAGLVIGVRQRANLALQRIGLAAVLGVTAQLGIAQVVVGHCHCIVPVVVVRIAIGQVHIRSHIRTGVVLLLLLLFVYGTLLALGTAPGVWRIETIFC